MTDIILGNKTAELVLLYIVNYGEGYTSGIAQTFSISKSQVRKQLIRLEEGGVLVGRSSGNMRLFQINPRYPLKKQLVALLMASLDLVSKKDKEKYYRQRTRPRRTGKKL